MLADMEFYGIPFSFLINTGLMLTLGLLLWATADITKREVPQAQKFLWLVVIVLLPIIGAFVYLVLGRRQYKKQK